MGIKDKEAAKKIMQDAMDSVPDDVAQEMCQLVKENSIEGCKAAAVDIVYTPALNLKKEERMDVGQVSFKDEAFRKLMKNVAKDKEIIKRIEKTRQEKTVDLAKEKEQRDTEERARRKQALLAERNAEKALEKERAKAAELKSYDALQYLDKTSNAGVSKTGSIEECRQLEEDFM